MRRIKMSLFCSLCFMLLLTVGFPLFGGGQREDTELLVFGSGGTGGTYYPLAGTLSSYLNKEFDDLNITVQSTGGSADNARLLGSDDIDFAFNNKSEIYWAYNGLEMFDEPIENIRVVAWMFSFASQWITLEESDIESIYDIRGKRIAIGPPGSGSALMSELVLEVLGLDEEVKISRLDASDAVRELQNRNVDVVSYMGHTPTSFVTEASTMSDIRMLDIGDPLREEGFEEDYPIYEILTIPAGTYEGIEEDIETPGGVTYWTARADLSEDIVYRCVKAIFSKEGLSAARDAMDVAKEFSVKNALTGAVAPIHPGAKRFFEEEGVDIPEVE